MPKVWGFVFKASIEHEFLIMVRLDLLFHTEIKAR